MRRHVSLTLFAVLSAFGLVLASGAGAQVIRRPVTQSGTPTVRTRAPVAVATDLRVGDLRWVRGQAVNVFAVLRSSLRRPVPNARVRLSVAGRQICSQETDNYGRVSCNYAIGAAASGDFPITATYAGGDNLAASTGAGTLTIGRSGYGGGLSSPGAPVVNFSGFEGTVGVPTRLRAAVTQGGAPLAQRVVQFSANGEWLAAATTDAAGVAALDYAPRAVKLRRMHRANPGSSGATNYLGGFQAWLLPRRDTTDAVVAAVAGASIFSFPELCAPYSGTVDGYPQRCNEARVAPRTMAVRRAPSFTVRRALFGRATGVSPGRYTIEAPQPPDPAPNADCNASSIDVPHACRRTCSRLEYQTYYRSGSLESLRGERPARCGWALDQELTPVGEDFGRGHDACARAAAAAGRTSWNHQVTIQVPLRVTGHFQFRDPHTQRTANGWRFKLIAQHEFRIMATTVPMTVYCR